MSVLLGQPRVVGASNWEGTGRGQRSADCDPSARSTLPPVL